MSWPDVASAAVELGDQTSSDYGVVPGTPVGGWNADEAWLSRSKRPRDRTGTSLAAGFSNSISHLPE